MSDRTVHARSGTGVAEIVRYDRAGKWYVEGDFGRERLSVYGAAQQAAVELLYGGEVFYGRPGGQAFDRLVRHLIREFHPS